MRTGFITVAYAPFPRNDLDQSPGPRFAVFEDVSQPLICTFVIFCSECFCYMVYIVDRFHCYVVFAVYYSAV